MSFDSEEENYLLFPQQKFINGMMIDEDDTIELMVDSKILYFYKIYENCVEKRHKKEYAFVDIIELKDYQKSFFFSRTRVLLLLDDILGVDVICIGNYHPFESQNDLKYVLGHEDQSFLSLATVRCKELLQGNLERIKFESLIIYKTCYASKLARIYLKDFDYEEDLLTIQTIREAIIKNEILKNIDIKIRGRYSGYIEDSLNGVSPENTYIQIINEDLNMYLNECTNLLTNLKRFLI